MSNIDHVKFHDVRAPHTYTAGERLELFLWSSVVRSKQTNYSSRSIVGTQFFCPFDNWGMIFLPAGRVAEWEEVRSVLWDHYFDIDSEDLCDSMTHKPILWFYEWIAIPRLVR